MPVIFHDPATLLNKSGSHSAHARHRLSFKKPYGSQYLAQKLREKLDKKN